MMQNDSKKLDLVKYGIYSLYKYLSYETYAFFEYISVCSTLRTKLQILNGTINSESNRKNNINKRFKVVNIYMYISLLCIYNTNIKKYLTRFHIASDYFLTPGSDCTFSGKFGGLGIT